MIDIPLGKALMPVEVGRYATCEGCCFVRLQIKKSKCAGKIACEEECREDGKNVIFDLVDCPAKEKGE